MLTDGVPPIGLSARLKHHTHALHGQAERSGIIHDMLRGCVTRRGYALFLRNLMPAYRELEAGLECLRLSPAIRGLALRAVYRSASLKADLTSMCGPRWADELTLLPEAKDYAARVADVAQGDGARLIAHAYTRTLGDLNGGQVLKRLLARTLGLEKTALSFYDFEEIGDLEAFRLNYRSALDGAAEAIEDIAPVMEEAAEAFRLNIVLSEAVRREAVRDPFCAAKPA